MSKFSNSISFNLRTTLDASGINQLQSQLSQVVQELNKIQSKGPIIGEQSVSESIANIRKVQTALSKSFNSQLNLFDLNAFQKQLNGLSLDNLQKSMSVVPDGAKAFNNILGTVGQLNGQFRSISSFTDKIFNTMGNTVRWGITASIFQEIQNSLYRSVDYVKGLDKSLNNIRIVTNASNADMRNFALYANEAAQAIGASTTSFTDAAQLYAQNGFNEQDYTRLAEITTKVANVTQQDTTAVSEQITALMAGYNMSIDQVEDSLSGMAVVAAASASDLEELATAEQKVASTANSLGVSQEQLTAQIGTIVSVTRQAPETVGNAMRTLYARIADLQMGKTLEDGTTLGNLSGTLERIGIQVLDDAGNLRNLGDVLEDLQKKWGDLSNAQQIALGTQLAGKYQLNPFMALMENADMYNEQLDMMQNSQGALDEQQAIYMDSIQARLQQLSTAGEGLIMSLFNPDDFKPFISGLTDVIDLATQFSEALGGARGILAGLGVTATKVFSSQIASGLSNIISNFQRGRAMRANEESLQFMLANAGANFDTQRNTNDNIAYNFLQDTSNMRSSLDAKGIEQYNNILKQMVTYENQYQDALTVREQAQKKYNDAMLEQQRIYQQNGLGSEKDIQKLQNQLDKSKSQLANFTVLNEQIDKFNKDGNNTKATLTNITEALESTYAIIPRSSREWTDLKNIIDRFNASAGDNAPAAISKLEQEINGLSQRYVDSSNQIQQALDNINSANQKVREQQVNLDTANSNVQISDENRKNLNISAQQQQIAWMNQQYLQKAISFAGSLGQIAFGIQQIQSLGSIISDDDLSSMEKATQLLMNLSMSLPMLASGLVDLKNGFKGITGLMANLAAAKEGLDVTQVAGSLSALGDVAVASSGGITLLGHSLTGLSAGLFTVAKAIAPLLGIGALIGVFAALGKAAWDGYNQAAIAAQNAQEQATRTAQAYTQVKNEYENLQSSIDSYNSAIDQLAQMEKGTNDWKEALIQVNDTVLQLIDNYPKLAAYVSSQNGQLSISAEGFDTVLQEQQQKVAEAALASASASQVANRASARSQRVDIGRGISFTRESYDIDTGQGYSVNMPERVSNVREDEVNAIMEMLKQQGQQAINNPQAIADALGTDVADPIVEAIMGAKDDFLAQLNTEQANDIADRQQMEAVVQNLLLLQEGYDASNPNNDAIVSYLANATGQDGQLYQNAMQQYQDMSKDELGKAYQEVLNNAASYEINGDNLKFLDEHGNEIVTLQSESVKDILATMDAANQAALNWQQVADMASSINTSQAAHEVSGLSAALMSGNSETDYDFSTISNADLDEIAGGRYSASDMGITDEFAKEQGYKDAEAYVDAFIEQAQKEFNKRQITSRNESLANIDEQDVQAFLSANDFSDEDYQSARDYARNQVGDAEGEYSYDFTQLEQKRDELIQKQQQVEAELGKESDEYKNLQSEIDATSEAIDSYNARLDDVAIESMSVYKGLQELGSVLSSNIDILRSGDTASEEYTNALTSVRDALALVLNIDSGVLSEDFITNADNLRLMQEAANGSDEALNQLRANAGKEIIANVELRGVSEEDASAIRNELLDLAAQLPEVEVGASIDDTDFVQKLRELLASGQMTADEVNNILSGLGYSAEITYKPFQVPDITYTPQQGVSFGTNAGGAAAAMIQGVTASIHEYTAQMPEIHTVGLGGGKGTGWRPSSSGGKKGGSGGSGGGGKGGGGGSGSSYTSKTKDPVEDAIDRYERVNAELDTLSNQFDKIAEEQDRLAGFDVADNISKQIALLKEQIKWEQEKLKIQKEEAQEYRDQLASQYGITYDAEGNITNYAEVYKRLLNNLNNLINQYNTTTTESGQEALDQQIEAAQDNFDKYNDLIEKYDELNSNSILETEKQIEDFYDQIEDLQIEAFQKAVDAVDNIKDLQETIIDFNAVFSGLNSDSPFRDMMTSLENLKTYWDVATDSVDEYYDELIRRNNEAMKNASEAEKQRLEYQNALLEAARKQYGQGTFEEGGTGLFDMAFANLNTMLEQIRQYEETGTSSIFGENAGSMYEVAKDIFDQATSLVEDYEGHIDDLRDAILDAIDEIGEKMDERLEAYENINDELDHYASIIEMVSGDEAWSKLNEVTSANINNNQAAIKEIQENIKVLTELRDSMEKGSEEWKAVNELITDQQSELLDKTEETVEQIVEMYERGVNQILDKWIESTGMGSDLDWIAEEWELINRNADYYLDDVNAAYEIQKLQGKYLDLLDQTNDLGIQSKITQQMSQQLEYLREKKNLSEYDVQYANTQLEILQKQIALEEAQRNKSQLKLRRDNQGNYSYVYSADEGDVNSARNDLLDAQNNAYNLSKDQIKQTQDDSLSAIQDARDSLEQIWTNANLTLEEKTKRTQTIIDSLKEYLAGTSEQLSESEKNIINDFIGMCEMLTEENSDGLQDIYDQIIQGNTDVFDQIDNRWQTSITDWLQNMDDFNAATDDAFQNLIDNFEGYQNDLDDLGDLAGMTFDDMSDSIQNAVDKTNDLANSTSDFINQLKNDAGTIREYENALAEMTAKIQDAENGMRAYQEQVNELQNSLTAKEQENANLSNQVKDLQDQLDAIKNGGGSGGSGGGGAGGGAANSNLAWGIAQAIWTYGKSSGWGNDPIRSTKLTKAYGKDFAKQVQQIINQNSRSGKLVNYDSMKYSSYNLIGYKSGGYLGNRFRSDEIVPDSGGGKLFVGHPGELVLNKTDTENILNAVDTVRALTAMARNGSYNEILRQSAGIIDMNSIFDSDAIGQGGTIYQVECTFPNATNVEEIQQAILTLPDIAPQYAYKY